MLDAAQATLLDILDTPGGIEDFASTIAIDAASKTLVAGAPGDTIQGLPAQRLYSPVLVRSSPADSKTGLKSKACHRRDVNEYGCR